MKSIILEEKSKTSFGQLLFYLGIFLLPSAFSISAILLTTASIIGFFIKEDRYFEDKWNLFFFIGTILLIISSIFNSFTNFGNANYEGLTSINSYIGLFNWVPFTLSFYGFQVYLRNSNLRKITAFLLLSGTVPVIFSIIGQMFLDWHGPLKALNGFIIWYQRPISGITGITGLFNNPNYLGSWLIIIWPFCLASFLKKDSRKSAKIISALFIILIFLAIILCASRGAWLALILSIPLFFGKRSFKWFIPFLLFIGTIILSIFIPIFGKNFQYLIKELIPFGIWSNFSMSNYANDISRVDIWKNSLTLIANNPLLGSGFSSFQDHILIETGVWKAHSHNLVLELMSSYGIPATLFIIVPFTLLVKLAYKKIFLNTNLSFSENIFDRAWIVSLILLALMHLVDIQYFDGRISIAGWILLSGIRKIIKN